ncbi:MAG: hypothetical protein AAF621_01110 [Pseudomonadota bacterium]
MIAAQKMNFQGVPLDIKSIAFDMAEGCLTEIKEIFFIEGKYPPVLRWCSYAQPDWPKPHQILSEYWRERTYVDEFSIEEIMEGSLTRRIVPYLAKVSRIGTDDNFKYDFIGERAAFFMGVPQTYDQNLISILEKTQSAQDLFNLTSISACGIRGQGMLVLSQDGTDADPILWNKMILPLTNRSGQVDEFVISILRMPPR